LPRLSTAGIVFALTALIATYFLVGGALNAIRSQQLQGDESRLQDDIRQLERRYERLTALKDYLNSDEYIEAVAREQLGLVRRGETGFVAIATQPSPAPAPGDEGEGLWWDILIR
jgi:cell division protein DivIC